MATKSAVTSRLRLGREAYRAKERDEKRWERARVNIRAGRPIYHDGIYHPAACPCYDCTYGQIALWKRAVRLGTSPAMMALTEQEVVCGRRGRDVGASGGVGAGVAFAGGGG